MTILLITSSDHLKSVEKNDHDKRATKAHHNHIRCFIVSLQRGFAVGHDARLGIRVANRTVLSTPPDTFETFLHGRSSSTSRSRCIQKLRIREFGTVTFEFWLVILPIRDGSVHNSERHSVATHHRGTAISTDSHLTPLP